MLSGPGTSYGSGHGPKSLELKERLSNALRHGLNAGIPGVEPGVGLSYFCGTLTTGNILWSKMVDFTKAEAVGKGSQPHIIHLCSYFSD